MESSWLALIKMPLIIGAVFAAYVPGVETRSEAYGALVFASFLLVLIIFLVVVEYWAPGLGPRV